MLIGAISATETRHVDENGRQNTHFTIHEFYYLGHVENRPYYNGGNDVSVELSDGAVWNVTGAGILTSLTVGEGCRLIGTVSVDGKTIHPEPGVRYEGRIQVKP